MYVYVCAFSRNCDSNERYLASVHVHVYNYSTLQIDFTLHADKTNWNFHLKPKFSLDDLQLFLEEVPTLHLTNLLLNLQSLYITCNDRVQFHLPQSIPKPKGTNLHVMYMYVYVYTCVQCLLRDTIPAEGGPLDPQNYDIPPPPPPNMEHVIRYFTTT